MTTSTGHPFWDLVIYISAVLIALGAIYKYVWPVLKGFWHLSKTIEKGAEDYRASGGFGGLKEQNDALQGQIADVKALAVSSHKELHPNGGGSLRDAVDRAARESREAAEKAVIAVGHAEVAAEGVTRLEEYARQNREGIADLRDQTNDVGARVTEVTAQMNEQDERITRHRLAQEETARLLRERLDRTLAEKQAELDMERQANEALRVSLFETLQIPDEGRDQ